jgi:CheY-like chemotaxis protein
MLEETTALAVTDPAAQAVPLRVLCVDDHHDAADSLGVMLGLKGFAVAVAHDAASALEAAPGFHPQACVLDITMPGMDGCDLARVLRDGPNGSELLLIALTALGDYTSLGRMADAGFDLHFEKPVEPRELFEALDEFARKGRPGA